MENLLGIPAETWIMQQKDFEYDSYMIANREKQKQILQENQMVRIPMAQLLKIQEEISQLNSTLNLIIAEQQSNNARSLVK